MIKKVVKNRPRLTLGISHKKKTADEQNFDRNFEGNHFEGKKCKMKKIEGKTEGLREFSAVFTIKIIQ